MKFSLKSNCANLLIPPSKGTNTLEQFTAMFVERYSHKYFPRTVRKIWGFMHLIIKEIGSPQCLLDSNTHPISEVAFHGQTRAKAEFWKYKLSRHVMNIFCLILTYFNSLGWLKKINTQQGATLRHNHTLMKSLSEGFLSIILFTEP